MTTATRIEGDRGRSEESDWERFRAARRRYLRFIGREPSDTGPAADSGGHAESGPGENEDSEDAT